MKRFQRGLATLLCISMTGSMFPVPVSAERTVSAPDIAVESAGQQNTGTEEETGGELALYDAQTDVTYLAYDEESRTMKENVCNNATELTSENTSWGKANQVTWFVARGDITMEKRVKAYGEVHLILADDCNLKIEPVDENNKYVGGIGISQQTYHLYIHAQSEGDKQGTLVCRYTSTSPTPYAALGDEGSITIDGGNITCEGNEGAGIGGSSNVTKGTIGTVTINGGTINATTSGFGAAIGSGSASASDGTVVINGGTINAESKSGAGIGGGSNNAGIVTITGGDITATGGGLGAGIGGGQSKTGTVTITGGKITAANTYQSDKYNWGAAGIGGGTYKNGTVTISGGEINATSENGAGIGGGYGKNGFGNDITITGGLVKAVSQKGSGIGPGYYSDTSNVAEEKLTIENCPFIFASGGSSGMEKGIYKQDDLKNWSNIISMDGSDGKVYGNSVTTAMDFEIAEDQTLVVPEGTTLAVGAGKTITNNGTIKVAGTMDSTDADKVTVNKPKYKLITNGKLDDVTVETTSGSDKIYYFTYKDNAVVKADPESYEKAGLIGWTVEGTKVQLQRISPLEFAMPANAVTVTALYGNKAITPVLNGKIKVSTDKIEISGIGDTETYGDLEYRLGEGKWGNEGTFTGLEQGTEYTIYVRYAGKDNFAASDAAQETVTTKKWASITEAEKVTGLKATYGQTLNDVKLPDNWEWMDSSVKVVLDTTEYEARFAPPDTDKVDYSNVKGYVTENGKVYLKTSLTVTVAKAQPVIQWNQTTATYIYTGQTVEEKELPELSVTLKNNESYSGTFSYSYREKTDIGEAATFITGLPTEPGVYEVKAAVPASGNYTAAESDVMILTIQYLEGAPNAVTTDKNGSEYTKWCPAEFYIKAPAGYTISDKADGTYGASFVYNAVSEEDQQVITYYLKNTVGQIAKKTLTAKIDRTAPDWNGDNFGINIKSRWWNSLLEEYIPRLYKADSLDVNVKANDSQSGVTAYYYYVQPSVYLAWTRQDLDTLYGQGWFEKVSATGNGEAEKLTELVAEAKDEGKLVYVCAVDAVGNRSDYICSNGIVFDNKAPTLNVEFQGGDMIWDTSVTCWLHCTEVGDYYYICKKAEEPAPSSINDFAEKISDVSKDAAAEVDTWEAKDGIVTGKISSEGYSEFFERYSQHLEITGLTSNTKYVLYMVATDEAGNASNVAALNFTTEKTKPYIERAPRLVGEYGQSLADMRVDDIDAKVVAAQGSETEVSGTWSVKEEEKTIIPEVETTETYTLVFTPMGENADRYDTVSCKVTPEVAKKAVTVVIADKERPYGQNNPEFTWNFAEGSGLVGEDSNEDLGITLDSTAKADSPAGKYAITGCCNSKKYNVNFTGNSADGTSGVLTITQAANKFTTVLVCHGYTYEKNKKPEPAVNAKYGTVKYRYASFGADGFPADEAYTDAIPVNAGTYAVIAYVEATDNYAALKSAPLMFKIAKADAPAITGEEQSYIYAAGSEGKMVSVEIAEKLPADKGDVVYSCDAVDAKGILSEAEVDESGKLTFRVNAVDASKIGKTATIKVKAVMQNYEDAEYTLTVQLTDKKSVELQTGSSVAVEGNRTLTYGQKLSALNLTKAVFVEAGTNTVVEGTLVWSEPEKVPAVGTTQADWVFRPVQDSIYKEMTGTIAVTVVKAPDTPTATPSSTPDSMPNGTPSGTPSNTPSGTPSSTPGSTSGTTSNDTPENTFGDVPGDTPENTSGNIPGSSSNRLKKGMKFTGADGAVYKIISANESNPTVMYYAAKKNAKGKVSVPATVKYEGVTYKVISIRAKAFANRKKVRRVIIGKNVSSIGKKAFYNCRKLKKVTMKTTQKIKKKVGSAAFKKTAKNIVFKLPAKKYKVYKKLLKKKGVSRKAIYKKYKKHKKRKK